MGNLPCCIDDGPEPQTETKKKKGGAGYKAQEPMASDPHDSAQADAEDAFQGSSPQEGTLDNQSLRRSSSSFGRDDSPRDGAYRARGKTSSGEQQDNYCRPLAQRSRLRASLLDPVFELG